MLFYCSLFDVPKEEMIGGAFVNAETPDEASDLAAKLSPATRHLQIMTSPIPASNRPIPAIGRLLSMQELEAIGPGLLDT